MTEQYRQHKKNERRKHGQSRRFKNKRIHAWRIYGTSGIPTKGQSAVIESVPKNRSKEWWPKNGHALLEKLLTINGE
jgi:hypothetical protein